MRYDAAKVGQLIRATRKELGITQKDLALISGTRERFIGDLESGKPTAHLGKTLSVLQALGIKIEFTSPKLVNP